MKDGTGITINKYAYIAISLTTMAGRVRQDGARIRINGDGRVMCHIPLGDLILQTELRVATKLNLRRYTCPCRNCHGGRCRVIEVIRQHHAAGGRECDVPHSLGDLILQTELRVATKLNLRRYPCPCRNCHGGRCRVIEVIRQHHATVGRDDFLTKSMIGGDPPEGYPRIGIWMEDFSYDDDVVDVAVDMNVGDTSSLDEVHSPRIPDVGLHGVVEDDIVHWICNMMCRGK